MADGKKYLVVIAGPTAAGKTDLAIEIAKHYHTEIISADSRQFYQELNAGTAKPAEEQLRQVKHHFINNKSITELYGAGHFEKEAIQLLHQLFKKHDVVVMVGGSGLYISAVLNGVDEFDEVPAELRIRLTSEYKSRGLAWLQEEVKKADPGYFETIDKNNPQRLLRALEVCVHSGKPYSEFISRKKTAREFIPVKILINPPREQLYKNINTRADEMMKKGFLNETKALLPFRHHNALKTVGYNELFEYLDGKTTLDQAVEKIRQHTRNYAKRQITWFKNKETFTEFEPGQLREIIHFTDAIING
jgi:tRNA dimethylallyltransferase